jgi:hypothetical protein
MSDLMKRIKRSAGLLSEQEIMEMELKKEIGDYFVCDSCGKKFDDKEKFHRHRKACAIKEEEDKKYTKRKRNVDGGSEKRYMMDSSKKVYTRKGKRYVKKGKNRFQSLDDGKMYMMKDGDMRYCADYK